MTENNVKKILFVVTRSNFGGAQKYIYDIVTNLPKNKFQVKVAAGGERELIAKLRAIGIETFSINELGRDVKVLNDAKSFLAIWSILKKEKPDILHLNSSKAGALGAIAGKLSGIPKIIFTAHGWAFNEERSFLAKIAIKLISWLTVALSHKTIAVSKKVFEETKTNFLDKSKKVELIRLGIPKIKLLSRNEARTKLMPETSENDFILGSIAELHKNKGLYYAVEAISILKKDIPNIKYAILGEGEEREKLEKNIKKNSLENSVVLLGYRENAAQYARAFDILLAPSVTEALGYALIEAGSAGVPIVASNVGGIPEIVKDMKTGILVRPKSPKEIAQAILYLYKHKTELKSFGREIKKHVTEEFSIDRMINEIVKLYES